jgi:hypothetical protein
VLVQATPLGPAGEEVLPEAALRGRAVLDVAYGTGPTPLVAAARGRGLAVVDGRTLLAARPRSSSRASPGERSRWICCTAPGDRLDAFGAAA